MVTRPLYDTNMMNYIWCKHIDTYNLTSNIFGYKHKEKTQICRFLLAFQFMHTCCTKCPDFWNKWSWGLCVTQIWCITYNVNRLTHMTLPVLYLVTIINKKLEFVDFFSYQFMHPCCTQMPRSWNKWSWDLFVTPIQWLIYNLNKLTHMT